MRALRSLRGPTLALLAALLFGTTLLAVLGESPLVLWEVLQNSLFTPFGLGYTLYYATPLIFTGLGVAVAFHCGLFNIGAEGQLYIGSIAVVGIAASLPGIPRPLALLLGALVAAVAGGVWGGVAGWLKAKRGSHEVIVTILLNFVSYSLVSYLLLYVWKDPETQNPETLIVSDRYWIPSLEETFGLFPSTPVNLSLFLGVVAAVAIQTWLFHSVRGFEVRTVGHNPIAGKFHGISVGANIFLAMFISGALSGLVGVNEVMGHQHRVIEGFSPGYGFTGIAVALLARSHPIGILFSAILFGALQNGAREIEFLSDTVTKEFALVLQGAIVAFVAAEALFERLWASLSAKFRKKSGEASHA